MKPGTLLLAALLTLLGACASISERPEPLPPSVGSVALNTASAAVTNAVVLPLNVGIQAFTSSVAPAGSIYDAAKQVRSIEQRYLPYLLKNTLDESGYFGAVRVVPEVDPSSEVMITGVITESSGMRLSVFIRVADATGRVWIEGDYHDYASELDYAADPVYTLDPFQDLYNRIANDIIEVLLSMDDTTRQSLQDIALVRYGAMLSPASFDRYLVQSEGVFGLDALPAREDPLLDRVLRIRESEYLFADSVDAHYERLFHQLGPTYAWWRHYGYELIAGNDRLSGIDATRGATGGSWYAMERIYKTYKEAKMNQDALRELTESFDKEARPTVTEISGRLVQLSGTLDEQYRQWRRILQALYDAEN